MTGLPPLFPVGRIRSSIGKPDDAPHQGREAGIEAAVEILPEYEEALEGIEGCRRIVIVCWLHLAGRSTLKVHPRGDPGKPLTGVFATRSPLRPNPLAIYTAELLEVRGTTLLVRGVDAVDGTPVIDIRPHAPRLDD